jgi:hypothetical protein
MKRFQSFRVSWFQGFGRAAVFFAAILAICAGSSRAYACCGCKEPCCECQDPCREVHERTKEGALGGTVSPPAAPQQNPARDVRPKQAAQAPRAEVVRFEVATVSAARRKVRMGETDIED